MGVRGGYNRPACVRRGGRRGGRTRRKAALSLYLWLVSVRIVVFATVCSSLLVAEEKDSIAACSLFRRQSNIYMFSYGKTNISRSATNN